MEKEVCYKDKYNHIISFGCMCSCALFLRKNGFRDSSYFFDWLTSDFFNNLFVVENDFTDVLNAKFFVQEYSNFPHLVTHKKYKFIYTHVFDTKQTYLKQQKRVEDYINKRISNFKNALSDNTLLVYYCRNKDEQHKIENSVDTIKQFVKQCGADIVFVFNNELSTSFPFKSFVIPYNNIHHPIGGEVSYPFEGEGTEQLIKWLDGRYDQTKKSNNLKFKEKRNIFRFIINKFKKFKKVVLKF